MDIRQFSSLVLKQYVPKHVKAYHIEKTSEMLTGGISFTNDWDMESCSKPYRLINEKGNISPNWRWGMGVSICQNGVAT